MHRSAPENKIKTTVGNTSDCNMDPACDGTVRVPNGQHTECGKFLFKIPSTYLIRDFIDRASTQKTISQKHEHKKLEPGCMLLKFSPV